MGDFRGKSPDGPLGPRWSAKASRGSLGPEHHAERGAAQILGLGTTRRDFWSVKIWWFLEWWWSHNGDGWDGEDGWWFGYVGYIWLYNTTIFNVFFRCFLINDRWDGWLMIWICEWYNHKKLTILFHVEIWCPMVFGLFKPSNIYGNVLLMMVSW